MRLVVNLRCSYLTCKRNFSILPRGTLHTSHIFGVKTRLFFKKNTFHNTKVCFYGSDELEKIVSL